MIWSRTGSSLLHRIRENDIQNDDFFICSQLMRHPSIKHCHFSICFKCPTTIGWSMLSSLATSYIVVRGSASMIALIWFLSTSDGLPLCSSPLRLLSPLQNFLNHPYPVCSLAVSGPNASLMLQVVSSALWPIFNLNKKIAQICIWSNNISIV